MFVYLSDCVIISIIEHICILLAVAFMVTLERKLMAAVQRRVGPNKVGLFGLGQSPADGAKLFAKELVIPRMANPFLFLTAPLIPFILGLTCWGMIPLTEWGAPSNPDLGIILLFAVTSLGVYGVIWGGWASNSKYAFMGSLRATAQMISYEVSIGLIVMPIILIVGSTNLYTIGQFQSRWWFIGAFFPSAILYLISLLAETNRAPFDLPEAEGELVSGYNIDYSAVIFTLFFLAEYTNILTGSAVYSILFLGAWNGLIFDLDSQVRPLNTTAVDVHKHPSAGRRGGVDSTSNQLGDLQPDASSEQSAQLNVPALFEHTTHLTSGLVSSALMAVKIGFILCLFIWARATYPRVRFSNLMSFCWKGILPISFSLLVFYAGLFVTLQSLTY